MTLEDERARKPCQDVVLIALQKSVGVRWVEEEWKEEGKGPRAQDKQMP
jgi:hypothetical protein